MSIFAVVLVTCGVLLTLGAVFAVIRAEKGPSMLDRTVALDIVVTTMVAAVALYAAYYRRADVVPLLVVLSLVGFVGSVTIARFAAVEPEGEGRVRTREEVAAEEAQKRAAELAEEEERRQRRAAASAEVVPSSARDTVEPRPDDEHHGGPAPEETR